MIHVQHLTFDYPGCRALDGVSFDVEPGSVTALVGANGAGKTTLMRCIAGLDTPLRGRILVAGVDVMEEPRQAHRKVGYLSDSFGLYQTLSVHQCLRYAAAAQGVPGKEILRAVETSVSLLGLSPYLGTPCAKLSRGWKQRVGIAQAIIHTPQVLILDEPASGLDPEARNSLAHVFRQLQSEGMTLLVSSHILSELDEYSTHMLILRAGKILESRALLHSSAQSRHLRVVLIKTDPSFVTWLSNQPGIADVVTSGKTVDFLFSGHEEAQPRLLADMVHAGFPVAQFMCREENLQHSYLASVRAPSTGAVHEIS